MTCEQENANRIVTLCHKNASKKGRRPVKTYAHKNGWTIQSCQIRIASAKSVKQTEMLSSRPT